MKRHSYEQTTEADDLSCFDFVTNEWKQRMRKDIPMLKTIEGKLFGTESTREVFLMCTKSSALAFNEDQDCFFELNNRIYSLFPMSAFTMVLETTARLDYTQGRSVPLYVYQKKTEFQITCTEAFLLGHFIVSKAKFNECRYQQFDIPNLVSFDLDKYLFVLLRLVHILDAYRCVHCVKNGMLLIMLDDVFITFPLCDMAPDERQVRLLETTPGPDGVPLNIAVEPEPMDWRMREIRLLDFCDSPFRPQLEDANFDPDDTAKICWYCHVSMKLAGLVTLQGCGHVLHDECLERSVTCESGKPVNFDTHVYRCGVCRQTSKRLKLYF